MSIVGTELVVYISANIPTDDTSTAGGAIDATRFADFTQIAANDTIQALSSNAADTMNITVVGRSTSGVLVSETKALTGTTAITFNTLGTVERVISADLASAAAGTITVQRTTGAVLIRTLAAGKRGFKMFVSQGASNPSSTVNYYAKLFWKNENGSLALLNAVVSQSADPDARITHALAVSVDETNTIANRVTAPGAGILAAGGAGTFDDTAKTVPGTNLAAGSAIGMWLNVTLPSADAAHKTTYTSQMAGSST